MNEQAMMSTIQELSAMLAQSVANKNIALQKLGESEKEVAKLREELAKSNEEMKGE